MPTARAHRLALLLTGRHLRSPPPERPLRSVTAGTRCHAETPVDRKDLGADPSDPGPAIRADIDLAIDRRPRRPRLATRFDRYPARDAEISVRQPSTVAVSAAPWWQAVVCSHSLTPPLSGRTGRAAREHTPPPPKS